MVFENFVFFAKFSFSLHKFHFFAKFSLYSREIFSFSISQNRLKRIKRKFPNFLWANEMQKKSEMVAKKFRGKCEIFGKWFFLLAGNPNVSLLQISIHSIRKSFQHTKFFRPIYASIFEIPPSFLNLNLKPLKIFVVQSIIFEIPPSFLNFNLKPLKHFEVYIIFFSLTLKTV